MQHAEDRGENTIQGKGERRGICAKPSEKIWIEPESMPALEKCLGVPDFTEHS